MKHRPELVGHLPELSEQVFGPLLEISKEMTDFEERSLLLSKDVELCTNFFNKSPQDQFLRRNIIRTVFVFLEACAYGLKRIALQQHAIYEVEFSPAELALLREEKYMLDDKGEAITQDNNFQRFVPNLKFALRCFAKAHGLAFALDTSAVPLTDSERVRNRITHPKKVSDLSITDDEIKRVETVENWFIKIVSELMKRAHAKSLRVRIPQVNPTTRLNVTKDYVVMQPDGNVYQFDTLEEAEVHKSGKIVEGVPLLTPLMFRTEDLRQGCVPE